MKNSLALNKKDYYDICDSLNINPEADIEATNILSKLLKQNNVEKSLRKIKKILTNKIVLIFAAGPSLPNALDKLNALIKKNRKKLAIIAIDGTTQALLEKQIIADIVITDLDGGLDLLRKSHQKGSILIVHGHGDNIPKINEFSDLLGKQNIIGSTQVDPTENVINFGGFTDGDRGVYLAANFSVKLILLVSFDFGNIVGRYSKPEKNLEDFPATERKLIKFGIAKNLLRNLIRLKSGIIIYSFINKIDSINEIEVITKEQLYDIINSKIFF